MLIFQESKEERVVSESHLIKVWQTLLSATAILIPVNGPKLFLNDVEYSKLIAKFIFLYKVPVILVADKDFDKGFPMPSDLPECLQQLQILDNKAPEFEAHSYFDASWNKIHTSINHIYENKPEENLSTDIFLSHRQSTGHFLAVMLYDTFRRQVQSYCYFFFFFHF